MGCDIHLFLEKRNKKLQDKEWYHCSFRGRFSEQTYEMFAVLNNVRNTYNLEPLPNRGLPDGISFITFDEYYRIISSKENKKIINFDYTKPYFSEREAKRWVKKEISTLTERYGLMYCSNPDWHSPNWCTTQEMEECYNKVFTKKDIFDSVEWLALINYMKTVESTEIFEVRAVFWFDN